MEKCLFNIKKFALLMILFFCSNLMAQNTPSKIADLTQFEKSLTEVEAYLTQFEKSLTEIEAYLT